jgi:hypothetical protein
VDRDLDAQIRASLAHQWIEAETQDLKVLSTLDPDTTRQITAELLALRGALGHVAGVPSGGVPIQVSLMPRDVDPSLSRGFFAQNLRANRVGVTTDSGRLAAVGLLTGREQLYLVYADLLLAGAPLRSSPLWLEEGYASFFSTLDVRGDTLWLGRPLYLAQRGLAQGVLPLDALVQLRAHPAREGRYNTFGCSAWIFTHYLNLGHRRGFTDRRPQLREYLALLQQGRDRAASFEAAFATTYAQMGEEVARYASYHLPQEELRLGELAALPEIRIRPLAERDVKQSIGELLLDFSRETPDLPRGVRASLERGSATLFDDVIRDGADDAVAHANWASSATADHRAVSRALRAGARARARRSRDRGIARRSAALLRGAGSREACRASGGGARPLSVGARAVTGPCALARGAR